MKKSSLIFLICSILLSSIGIIALTRPGFFLTDDGNSMIIRFSAFYEAIRHGQFPVRFLSRLNQGYGYPVADFLYPLFMYIGVPIKAVGFSFVNTVKIILAISFLSGTIFSFLWLGKLFDNVSALAGSVVYSLFPYHLFDIYARGSVGEALALGIVPFIFWAVEKRNLVLTSIGYFLLITAHNSLALIFIPVVFVYSMFKDKNNSFFSLILGSGLSSFFVLPALYDKQYTIFDSIKISDFSRYFISGDNLVLVGLISLIGFIFSLPFLRKMDNKFLLFFILFILSIFLSSPTSLLLWNLLPFESLIQFPFRFLSLTLLSVSFLISYIVFAYKKRNKIFLVIFLLAVTLITARGFLVPEKFQNYPDSFYSTNLDTTTVKGEYMPKWVKVFPKEIYKAKVENLDGQEKINLTSSTPNSVKFDVYLSKKSRIRINTVFFPGWVAYVNGSKSNIIKDDGLINLDLNRGYNNVLVKFEETNFRLFSDILSIFSILVILYLTFKKYVKFL